MAQYHYINQGATLPTIRMELVKDAKYDFIKGGKYANAIQNADVTFSMWDENDVLVLSDAPCGIILETGGGCEEHYIIEYRFTKRDTKKKGKFKGQFKIDFHGDIYEEGVDYHDGLLIMPIYEDVYVMVK